MSMLCQKIILCFSCSRLFTSVLQFQGLQPASWPDALHAVKKGLEGAKGNEIRGIAGKLADAESMVLLKVILCKQV